jgi:hypothetical protein
MASSTFLFQLPKADCSVDIVAQRRAARFLVAGEHELDGFTKQRLAESRLPLGTFADRFAEIFGQWHRISLKELVRVRNIRSAGGLCRQWGCLN